MLASSFSTYTSWPKIKDFNKLFLNIVGPLQSANHKNLCFIEQSTIPGPDEQPYEIRAHQSGEILTRVNNWHDFFQVMIWCSFPQTKKLINAMHFSAIQERLSKNPSSTTRSPVENTLTLFDECGAIIVSSSNEYLDMIKNHDWKKLFVDNRDAFDNEIKCFIFGHAMFEKALSPYLGMTTQSILIKVDSSFFSKNMDEQKIEIDDIAQHYFTKNNQPSTKMLQPFPILGVPEWDSKNCETDYYNNKDYFRMTPNTSKTIEIFEYRTD